MGRGHRGNQHFLDSSDNFYICLDLVLHFFWTHLADKPILAVNETKEASLIFFICADTVGLL